MIMDSPMIFRKLVAYDYCNYSKLTSHNIVYHDNISVHRVAIKVFDYVHNEMKIPHELIARYPMILDRRLHLIDWRHSYLKKLGRDQYDPKKPLYVPLSAFFKLEDNEFCEKYAKTSVHEFNLFLKTV